MVKNKTIFATTFEMAVARILVVVWEIVISFPINSLKISDKLTEKLNIDTSEPSMSFEVKAPVITGESKREINIFAIVIPSLMRDLHQPLKKPTKNPTVIVVKKILEIIKKIFIKPPFFVFLIKNWKYPLI